MKINKKIIVIGVIIVCIIGYVLYGSIKTSSDEKMQNWCIDQLIQQVSYSGNPLDKNYDSETQIQNQCMSYRVMRDGGNVKHHPLYVKLDGNLWITDYILPPDCAAGTKCPSLPITNNK